MKSRNLELHSRVQGLERELRQTDLAREAEHRAGKSASTSEAASPEDLRDRLRNQEGELSHLRLSLLAMQNQCTKENAKKNQLQKRYDSSRAVNSKLELSYSKLAAKHNRIKTAARDLHKQLLAKHEMVQKLKKESSSTEVAMKAEPGSEDLPPPDAIPDLDDSDDLAPASIIDMSAAGPSDRQIVLNVNPTVGDARDDEDEEVDVDGGDGDDVGPSGGVSPPRSSYVAQTVSEAEMRDFFPDEDNLPPLTFDPPNSRLMVGTANLWHTFRDQYLLN